MYKRINSTFCRSATCYRETYSTYKRYLSGAKICPWIHHIWLSTLQPCTHIHSPSPIIRITPGQYSEILLPSLIRIEGAVSGFNWHPLRWIGDLSGTEALRWLVITKITNMEYCKLYLDFYQCHIFVWTFFTCFIMFRKTMHWDWVTKFIAAT
jgi:hypothetical protein